MKTFNVLTIICKGWNNMETRKVDSIAKTKLLTRDLLIEEVLPNHAHSEAPYFKGIREKILSDLGVISSRYDLEEKVVIYVFLSLWHEGMVNGVEFATAYEEKWLKHTARCIRDYYMEIKEYQEKLGVARST